MSTAISPLFELYQKLIDIIYRLYTKKRVLSLDDLSVLQASVSSQIYKKAMSDPDKYLIETIKKFSDLIYQSVLTKEVFLKKRDQIFLQFEYNISSILNSDLTTSESSSDEALSSQDLISTNKRILTANSISSAKISKRSNYPKNVTFILKHWLQNNLGHPYPDEDQKLKLSQQTGLCLTQINNWFINARRRILPDLAGKYSR